MYPCQKPVWQLSYVSDETLRTVRLVRAYVDSKEKITDGKSLLPKFIVQLLNILHWQSKRTTQAQFFALHRVPIAYRPDLSILAKLHDRKLNFHIF